MMAAAGIALIGTVAALGLTALQALANPSGTVVVSVSLIVVAGIVGMMGLAVFGALWFLRNNKRT